MVKYYIKREDGKLLHKNIKKHSYARALKNAKAFHEKSDAQAYIDYVNDMFDEKYEVMEVR